MRIELSFANELTAMRDLQSMRYHPLDIILNCCSRITAANSSSSGFHKIFLLHH